ncbi:MAG: glycosyltransferase family 4 protein, partial [Flavobacteriales bacterium]
MKLVILTQYFPPEVGAPQNRLFELATRLQQSGWDVTILTAMPNYPSMEIHADYRGKRFVREEMNGLNILRSSIYVSKSKGIVARLRNYYSFVWSSWWVGLKHLPKHDILMVESPPLFLGKSAWMLSRFKGSKLIFNVSDLWPESAEKLGIVKNRFFLWISYRLEAFLYKRSWLITGQTQGIVADIQQRFPKKSVHWLPNGVNVRLFKEDHEGARSWRSSMGIQPTDFVALYAGIIGYAQGLDVILQAAQHLQQETRLHCVLLGSGPEKDRLVALAKALGLKNVHFLEPVVKSEMPAIITACDAALIPLRKLDLFLGAIPSKTFENMALRKPIVLGVDGEARELFITQGKGGFYVEPE